MQGALFRGLSQRNLSQGYLDIVQSLQMGPEVRGGGRFTVVILLHCASHSETNEGPFDSIAH